MNEQTIIPQLTLTVTKTVTQWQANERWKSWVFWLSGSADSNTGAPLAPTTTTSTTTHPCVLDCTLPDWPTPVCAPAMLCVRQSGQQHCGPTEDISLSLPLTVTLHHRSQLLHRDMPPSEGFSGFCISWMYQQGWWGQTMIWVFYESVVVWTILLYCFVQGQQAESSRRQQTSYTCGSCNTLWNNSRKQYSYTFGYVTSIILISWIETAEQKQFPPGIYKAFLILILIHHSDRIPGLRCSMCDTLAE